MLFKTVSESLGYRFNDRGINKFTNKWYSNNCLVRYEYPICENDTDIENFHDLFTYMCETTIMPDTEFLSTAEIFLFSNILIRNPITIFGTRKTRRLYHIRTLDMCLYSRHLRYPPNSQTYYFPRPRNGHAREKPTVWYFQNTKMCALPVILMKTLTRKFPWLFLGGVNRNRGNN